MGHQDEELSDVVVVLEDNPGITLEDAVNKLKAAGLSVTEVDTSNGVVEGTLPTEKSRTLSAMPFVKYVRNVFNYTADFPPGDPRDRDGQDDDDSDVDDAGA